MSKLKELMGKSTTITIGNIQLDLQPLTLDELSICSVDEGASAEEQFNASKKIVTTVLKKSVPDATDEEINNISSEYLLELMEQITKINKLDKPNVPRKIK